MLTLAMPIGLPAADAGSDHYSELAARLDVQLDADGRVAIRVADEDAFSAVAAVSKGLLRYLPAGTEAPDGSRLAMPALHLSIWLWDYLALRRYGPDASSVPRTVIYLHIDSAAVTDAIDAELGTNGRYEQLTSEERVELQSEFIAGTRSLLVEAGTAIGRGLVDPSPPRPELTGYRRVDLEFRAGSTVVPADACLDLWGLISGPLVTGHPLLAMVARPVAPAIAPLEGGTRIRVAGSGLPPDVAVDIGGVPAEDVQVSPDGSGAYADTPPRGPGAADVVLTVPGNPPVVYPAALTYVSDVVATARAVVASYVVVLGEVRNRAAALVEAGELTDTDRGLLQVQADVARNMASVLVATRSAEGGGSGDDPEIADAWAAEQSRIAALLAELASLVG